MIPDPCARKLYEDVRRDSVMCQALQELMKDEIEEKLTNAETETQVKVPESQKCGSGTFFVVV
jgi:helix-turn-helix protein